MTSISILGTGNMGSAIAGVVEKGGNPVQLLGEDAANQAVTGDIVVLAVPYPALSEIVAQRSDQRCVRTE